MAVQREYSINPPEGPMSETGIQRNLLDRLDDIAAAILTVAIVNKGLEDSELSVAEARAEYVAAFRVVRDEIRRT